MRKVASSRFPRHDKVSPWSIIWQNPLNYLFGISPSHWWPTQTWFGMGSARYTKFNTIAHCEKIFFYLAPFRCSVLLPDWLPSRWQALWSKQTIMIHFQLLPWQAEVFFFHQELTASNSNTRRYMVYQVWCWSGKSIDMRKEFGKKFNWITKLGN